MTVPAESPPVHERMDASDGAADFVPAPTSGGAAAHRSAALLSLVQACLRERSLIQPADADDEMPGHC